MREGGKILAAILRELAHTVKPGMRTCDISHATAALMKKHGVQPSFKGYHGYTDVICLAVNHQAVHTPGSDYELCEGDLLKLDCGVLHKGLHTDSAVTVLVAENPGRPEFDERRQFLRISREALDHGIAECKPGNRMGKVSAAIQRHVERGGFSIVRELGGHGIGRELHEEPWIANFGRANEGVVLEAGMVIALEPITAMGKWQIKDGADGFTYEMKDGSLSAHFEHTIAITETGHEVLTV